MNELIARIQRHPKEDAYLDRTGVPIQRCSRHSFQLRCSLNLYERRALTHIRIGARLRSRCAGKNNDAFPPTLGRGSN